MNRRVAYRRAERVLESDSIGVLDVDTIKSELLSVLSNYMKVYDMHIDFKKLEGGKTLVNIVSKVSNIKAPLSLK